jgi:hypothetical protein
MAILLVAFAAVMLVVLSRRSAPWWASALVIAIVALPWVAGYVDEVGDDDTSPGLLVFGGVLSVGALLILELLLRTRRRRVRRRTRDAS